LHESGVWGSAPGVGGGERPLALLAVFLWSFCLWQKLHAVRCKQAFSRGATAPLKTHYVCFAKSRRLLLRACLFSKSCGISTDANYPEPRTPTPKPGVHSLHWLAAKSRRAIYCLCAYVLQL
jgi:hypothetical protein